MRTIFVTILVGILVPVAYGQQSDDQALQAKLAKLEKDSWEADKRQDRDFFQDYLSDDFVGIYADGTSVTKKELIQNLADFKITSYSMDDVKMQRINKETAFILYRLKYDGLVAGKPTKLDAVQASSLYVLRGGKWWSVFYQETEIRKK